MKDNIERLSYKFVIIILMIICITTIKWHCVTTRIYEEHLRTVDSKVEQLKDDKDVLWNYIYSLKENSKIILDDEE